MDIKYKVYSDPKKIESLCLRDDISSIHEKSQLKWIYRMPLTINVMCVAYTKNGYNKDVPVGVSVNVKKTKYNLQLCVLPEFRKMGIGEQLVKEIIETFGPSDYKKSRRRIRVYRDSYNSSFFNKVLGEKKMKKVDVVVRGVKRSVYLESLIEEGKYRARTYVGSKTVSGTYQVYANGSKRFTPSGVNAALV